VTPRRTDVEHVEIPAELDHHFLARDFLYARDGSKELVHTSHSITIVGIISEGTPIYH
jgi:hypothetical protein